MGKTIRFNENGLIAIKKKLNEIMVGTESVSHNDVSPVKLYHGTDIPALLKILKTNRICASEGVQHGETHGLNWFSLVNDGSFNRGACFSLEIPADEIGTTFKKMNNAHLITRDSYLDISNYNIQVEYFCGFSREGIINLYNNLVKRGEKYPIEWIRDDLFYKWCEKSGNEDVYMSVSDYDFGIIMVNILGEDKVRKEGFISESVGDEFAPVGKIGGKEKKGTVVAGGNYFHMKQKPVEENINFNDNGLSMNDDDILSKYNLKDLILSKSGNYVTLNKIVANELGKGYGGKFMEYLTKLADKNGWILALTPDTSFGASSVGRLKNFYKKYGFAPNKGRNTDFNTRESMVRKPLRENKYDNEFSQIINELEAFRNNGAKKYGQRNWYAFSWMERYHPEIKIDPKDVSTYNSLVRKYEEITKLWNDEYRKEEEAKNTPKSNYIDYISLAIKEYGLTNDIVKAGYILPDGSLLNFDEGEGYRTIDHRNIEGIFKRNGIEHEYRGEYVSDFLNCGAIRCCCANGLLNMQNEPTSEQYSAIETFVRYVPNTTYLNVEFDDVNGNQEHYASYLNANPKMVVSDIYKYYNEGIKPQGNADFESNEKNGTIIENYEKEVESSEVDLSSFKKRDTLPPGIWKDEETLNSKVRLKLLDIADDFWEFVNLTWVEPKGIILTGSICNFNWSKFSDIDLHLIVDFSEIDSKTEFVREYLDSKKNEWNTEHEGLKIMGFPVELYAQNIDENPEAGGIYDLEENAWVRKPNPHTIKNIGLNKFNIKDKAAEIMTIIDDMYQVLDTTDDSHKVEEIGNDASYLWKKVNSLRKKSLNKNGESGAGNIVYKVLRREFYLDKLWKLRTLCYDKLNSI